MTRAQAVEPNVGSKLSEQVNIVPLRLWTIQPLVVWEQLQQLGLLLVDETRTSTPDYVPDSYQWLALQLKLRLPQYPGTIPWWAYCEKPDLRLMRHHRPAGERHVRLDLEPRPGTFLTYPLWAWDTIYCGNYLSFARQEHEEWIAAMRQAVPSGDTWPLPEPWRTQLEASWLRLFDPDLPGRPWDVERNTFLLGKSGTREAVLGVLRLDEVRQVTHFVGRSKWGR